MEGEEAAAEWLRANGFEILYRNWRSGRYELDIVATNFDRIHFVEVKTRKAGSLISGVEAVDERKRQRILLSANDYIVKTLNEKQPRFDVAEVVVSKNESGKTSYKLRYIENAF